MRYDAESEVPLRETHGKVENGHFNKTRFTARSCKTKMRFKDYEDAKRFRRRLAAKIKDSGGEADATRIYECPVCCGYHFASDRRE